MTSPCASTSGKVRDPSAIVVVEGFWHRKPAIPTYEDPNRTHILTPAYHVTHIERFDLGTPYPVVVDRVLDVGANVGAYRCIVDATGVGTAVVDMFTVAQRERHSYWPRLEAYTLTGGEHGGDRSISKTDLTGAIKRWTSHRCARHRPARPTQRRQAHPGVAGFRGPHHAAGERPLRIGYGVRPR